MKKIFITITALLIEIGANAQTGDKFNDGALKFEALHIFAAFANIALFATAIYIFVKLLLDNRIKNKLLDKGAPEDLAMQLLQPTIKNDKTITIKWVCILTGLGIGLLIANYTQPLGIHSLAIMCLSLAASLLGYFIFIRYSDKV
jgi:hypothetical protein